MRISPRNVCGNQFVIGESESEEESKIIDLLGDDFTNRDAIPITGEIRLVDGYCEHYILLKPVKDECPFVIVEKFTDNGEHSHWELVDKNTGSVKWSE